MQPKTTTDTRQHQHPPESSDLSRMGLHPTTDGSALTLTPAAFPALFGRPALYDFRLTMATTTLHQLRHLITQGDGRLHLPVTGQITAHDGTTRPTSRLIATAQQMPFPLVTLEVTTWLNDGTEAWLDVHLLDHLSSADRDHLHAVLNMWRAGVRPLHDAARYVAAGLSAAEAYNLINTSDPAERDAQIDLLIALRTG